MQTTMGQVKLGERHLGPWRMILLVGALSLCVGASPPAGRTNGSSPPAGRTNGSSPPEGRTNESSPPEGRTTVNKIPAPTLPTPHDRAARLDAATGPQESVPATAAARRVMRIFAGTQSPEATDIVAMQETIQRVSHDVVAATVGVRVGDAHGSGVIVSADGYVLTAAHVAVEPDLPARVIMSDGHEYAARTLGMELGLDAGMVKLIDAGPAHADRQGTVDGGWPFLRMADSRRLTRGQWCLATGHPGGYRVGRQPVLRIGRVLNSSTSEILTDCTLVGGDSGGPLLDLHGDVIGIHSRIGAPLTANLHVPAYVFREAWSGLVNSETHGPYLGVRHDNSAQEARVQHVPAGSPAARAGVMPGDIVVRFEETPIKDFNQLREHVLIKQPGDKVTLRVVRDGTTLDLEVALGDWSESAAALQR